MSRLTCTQCENMLLDAADGILLTEDETHFRLHLADCPNCTKMFADIERGGAWMEMLKAAPPVPPEGMVNRILAQTSGDPAVRGLFLAQAAQAASLFGGSSSGAKVLPFRVPEARTPWTRMVHTVMQPRFAMTAAMAFFSIALTMNLTGVHLSSVHAEDLKPTNIRKSFWAANNSVVRYYDNLRVVYELESRVHEMQRDSDSDTAPQRGVVAKPEKSDDPQRSAPSGQPKSEAPRLWRGPAQSEVQEFHLRQVKANNLKTVAAVSRTEGVKA